MAKQTAEALGNFQFDNDEVFFGITNDGTPAPTKTDKVIKEVKGEDDDDDEEGEDLTPTKLDQDKDKAGKEKEELKKKKEREAEVDKAAEDLEFFEDKGDKTSKKKADKKEEEEEEETTTTEEDEDKEFFTTLAKELKEEGVLQNVEVPKDKTLTRDEFFDLQAEEIESRVTEVFESFAEGMDADEKGAVKYMKDGGKLRDYKSQYIDVSFDLKDLDETDPKQVQKVLRYYIMNYEDTKDDEEIQDRLKYIKEGGKEISYAAKWFKTIKADDEETRENLIKAQEKATAKKEAGAKEFKEKVETLLKTTQAIGAFPISVKEQKELAEYMNKPTVKIGKNTFVPAFQVELTKALRATSEKDLKNLIIVAKLFKNKFDVSDLVTETTTEVARRAQQTIKTGKTGLKLGRTSGNGVSKQLTDYFQEE